MTVATCDVCSKSYGSLSNIFRHYQTHSSERPLQCRFCGKRTTAFENLKRHEKHTCRNRSGAMEDNNNCSKNGQTSCQCQKCSNCRRRRLRGSNHVITFYCDNCDRLFSCVEGLTNHMRNKHLRERPPQCDDCGKSLMSRYVLGQHTAGSHLSTKVAAALKASICHDCDKPFASLYHLQEHIRHVHNGLKSKLFNCIICQKSYANRFRLKFHRCVTINDRRMPFECDVCDKKFANKNNCKTHAAVAHVSTQIDVPNRPKDARNVTKIDGQRVLLQCSKCVKWFARNDNLQEHERLHKTTGLSAAEHLPCRICDKLLPTKAHLQRHMRCVHEDQRRFACSLCKRHYSQSGTLKTHMRKHHGEEKIVYKCDRCDHAYIRKDNLAAHATFHPIDERDSSTDENEIANGRAVFQCSKCVQRCRSGDDLRTHERLHQKTSVRYSCPLCAWSTTSKGSLWIHERRHIQRNIKVFICFNCERSVTSLTSLGSHQILKHRAPTPPYQCDICDKNFTIYSNLILHNNRIHFGRP